MGEKFFGWLCDTALNVMMILMVLGVWLAPMWLKITLCAIILIGCGLNFNLIKLVWDVLVVIIIMDVWVAPMWVRVIITIFALVGVGLMLKDVVDSY